MQLKTLFPFKIIVMSKTIAAPPPKKDNPGVFIPPPILYAIVFVSGIFLQKNFPLSLSFFKSNLSTACGIGFIVIALLFIVNGIRQFILSRNTLITVKPAASLQTTGIYAISRNPMYVGLITLYIALSFLVGNWWNLLLLPVLILVIYFIVIRKEEKYLERAFGTMYTRYKQKVRRWI